MSNKNNKWAQAFYPWMIWFLGALFFFYKYLIQVSPSVMTEALMKTFNVHGAGLGHLSAFYFYAYLFMQVPVGILLDRYSPRLLTGGAILFCSLGTFIFSQSNVLWLACLARAMMGMGAAFAAVSCFKFASLWFPPKRFALVSGLCMTAAMLGGVFGQMPLSFLVQSIGWRQALELISFIGLVLGVCYLIVVRDKPLPALPKTVQDQAFFSLLVSVLWNRQTWLLSLYSGLAFAPISVFGGLWGVPFLELAYDMPKNTAAFCVSWIFIGFAIGAPLFGYLSDAISQRKPILYVGTLLALCFITPVIYTPILSTFWVSFFLFMFGLGTSGFFTSFAMIRELFPVLLAGSVLGFMNTFDSICEAFYEPLVGTVLDLSWTGEWLGGVPLLTIKNYEVALSLLPVSLLASFLLLFFIRETHCVSFEENKAIKKPEGSTKNRTTQTPPLSKS